MRKVTILTLLFISCSAILSSCHMLIEKEPTSYVCISYREIPAKLHITIQEGYDDLGLVSIEENQEVVCWSAKIKTEGKKMKIRYNEEEIIIKSPGDYHLSIFSTENRCSFRRFAPQEPWEVISD